MKLRVDSDGKVVYFGRSRKGAWIEILKQQAGHQAQHVAPVRERGLKYFKAFIDYTSNERRSRKGAWIEMQVTPT